MTADCDRLPWSYGPAWCRVNSSDCAPGPHPQPHPQPAPAPDDTIRTVHVVAMVRWRCFLSLVGLGVSLTMDSSPFQNHLDVGFSCKGCGGSSSPRDKIDGMSAPFTSTLLSFYVNEAIPMAINTSRALAASGNASYTYTTHCFLVSFFLDCPQHWPELRCPAPQLVKDFHDAVDAGWITWHAFPHNGEPETFDAELFADGIGLCHALDDRFGKPHASVLSQRDVPGLTRSVIPLLAQQDVLALSVGANTYSASAAVPRIYRWREPQSNLSVIALQHPGGYGDGSTVVMPNGSSGHALHLLFNGDNAGPHSVEQVTARFEKLRASYPKAEVIGSTWDAFVSAIVADRSAETLEVRNFD